MMCAAKSGEVADTQEFVGPITPATTAQEFNDLDAKKIQDYKTFNYESKSEESDADKYNQNPGYQPYESIKGYIEKDSSNKIVRPDSILNVQRAGMYGQCSDSGVLNFLRPSERSTCSFIPKKMDQSFCETTLSLENLFKMKIYKTGDTSDDANLIGITINNVKKYNYQGDYDEITLKGGDDAATAANIKAITDQNGKPTWDGTSGSGSCDNFVLQYELRIKYSAVPDAAKAGFSIDEATLDLVYGKVDATEGEQIIPRASSVSFFQSDKSRASSGTPGYMKNFPIKTATRKIEQGDDYMEELSEGMYFRGADNTGQCIEVEIPDTTPFEEKMRAQWKSHPYIDDPLFTFSDSIMYGCHKDMNFQELKEFCTNKDYEKLLIFQYLNHSLSHLGKFGNSNPHYVSDWVEVSKEERGRVDNTLFDEDLGVCQTMSSSLFISIYYQSIGRVDKHQHEIVSATMRWSNTYK